MIWDVIVVGAGPAGSTFARLAAASDKKILIIDGQSAERKKPCGGLLAPDAQKLFAKFDFVLPKEVLVDPQIFSVRTIDLVSRRIRHYQRYYMNMDRYAFDRLLLSLVPDTVTVMSGRCIGIERSEEGYALTVKTSEGVTELRVRNIVGADGASSIVRRSIVGGGIYRYNAIQQWFLRDEGRNPFYSCIFDPQTSDSCSWMMYKDEYMIFGGCFPVSNSRAMFEEQKKRVEAFLGHEFGEPMLTEACQACRPKHWQDFVTGDKGAYLIGEAAGFISASSFEGISSAIWSGSLLAEAMSETDDERKVASRYRRLCRRLKLKLLLKIKKRWFMYTPWVRGIIMETGLQSIETDAMRNQTNDK